MTAIETMAFVVVALVGVKILVILVDPKSWIKVIKTVHSVPVFTTLVSLVLAGVTLNYLLEELTIVQIFGSMLFFMFLMMIGVSAYSKEVVPWATNLLKNKNTIRRSLLVIVVWVGLMIWVTYELFM